MTDNPMRDLPSVDALANSLPGGLPSRLAVSIARSVIRQARDEIAAGGSVDIEALSALAIRRLQGSTGMPVVNATGVLLHTNLGRAPWSEDAAERAAGLATGYSTLEIDIVSGERGRRGSYVETLLGELTGAEAALVVNNNAAAVLLALAAAAGGSGVPVSRGELIEIGGAYRLPDVMTASGVRLIEVGTTNRTRVGDYVTALQIHRCSAILKAHPSNYRVVGFTEEATVSELSKVASTASIPLLYDLGSGLLDSTVPWLPSWLAGEPGVAQSLADGADLVMFSGDKLLGGPQAGIIVGTQHWIDRLRSHPLARALRVDGVTYTALGATLEAHLDGTPATLPFWRMALAPAEELRRRAETLADRVGGTAEPSEAAVGAGSAPGVAIPSHAVRLISAQGMFSCLLDGPRPVLAKRDAGDLVLDLRAVVPDDDQTIVDAITRCL
ncbi:MAG TPA: L-seryl-tRNA(Sec) selenium transferase [Acidimicrobiia bacterium]